TDGGDWQLLGSYTFHPGKSEGVTLSDKADGVVVADALRWVGPIGDASAAPSPAATTTAPAVATPAPTPPPAPAATATPAPPPSDGPWTVALESVPLRAGADANTDVLATVPQFSYLQILGYSGDWAYVYNPRARGTAYALSRQLGPSDPPPAWVTAAPPAAERKVEEMGRTVGPAHVAFYPVADPFAYVSQLGHNRPILVHDRVRGEDGSTWYRVDQGYLAESAVRLPSAPQRTFRGRWIDADLREPAMLVAYEGDTPVYSTLTIKGRVAYSTPTGVFSIGRRVEDETMDSSTLGVPRDAPEGYHLEHVLYTQYFTSDGASIHYNYWSSNFGYSGSHGCLGVDLPSSEFLWRWATLGTPVVIHS
ncbi:MAG TPA: L,D-transpeptidase family protein, partial [Chloroflexota bacterium]|nr:L,D-transpeptidase family protein [Chloroflexota bacterium]